MPWCTLANQPGYTDTPAMECSEHGLCQVARGHEFVFRNSHPHLIDLAMDQSMSKYLGGPEFGGIKIHFGSGDGKQMGLS